MIRDVEAYARLRVDDERRALSALDAAESLAVGEALWTSSLAREVYRPSGSRPLSLAVGLGIAPARLAAAQTDRRPFRRAEDDRRRLDVVIASLPFEERARERATRRRLFDRDVPMPTPRTSCSSR